MLVWAKICLEDDLPIVVHENTLLFAVAALVEILKCKYVHVAFDKIGPCNVGNDAIGRPRRVDIFLHRKKVRILGDIPQTFQMLSDHLREAGPC